MCVNFATLFLLMKSILLFPRLIKYLTVIAFMLIFSNAKATLIDTRAEVERYADGSYDLVIDGDAYYAASNITGSLDGNFATYPLTKGKICETTELDAGEAGVSYYFHYYWDRNTHNFGIDRPSAYVVNRFLITGYDEGKEMLVESVEVSWNTYDENCDGALTLFLRDKEKGAFDADMSLSQITADNDIETTLRCSSGKTTSYKSTTPKAYCAIVHYNDPSDKNSLAYNELAAFSKLKIHFVPENSDAGIGMEIEEDGQSQTIEYYTLNGVKLSGKPSAPGLYIKRCGGKAKKAILFSK